MSVRVLLWDGVLTDADTNNPTYVPNWYRNFCDTLPFGSSIRYKFKEHNATYIPSDQSGDGNIYIEFDSEEDLTLFMLRFS
jgi:hypothetical protein